MISYSMYLKNILNLYLRKRERSVNILLTNLCPPGDEEQ